MAEVLRLAAFADGPSGGNPAGVVLDASGLDSARMLAIAAEVGAAETAFVVGERPGAPRHVRTRYFSPVAEVPFCGHATIATAVVLAERDGHGLTVFDTAAGPIQVRTRLEGGAVVAAFTSVEPAIAPIRDEVLGRLLALLGVAPAVVSSRYPPRAAFAGNLHPVVVIEDREVFDAFTFEPAPLRALMVEQGWLGTVTVLRPVAETEFEARNLFPVGTMAEDPATGSAAASVGAYLRHLDLVRPPVEILIRQGRHVGRPSLLRVDVPVRGGITVRGGAVRSDR